MCTKLSSAKYKIFCGQQIRQISMEFPEHAKDNSVHRICTKLSLAKYKNVCASNEVDGHSWNSTNPPRSCQSSSPKDKQTYTRTLSMVQNEMATQEHREALPRPEKVVPRHWVPGFQGIDPHHGFTLRS